MRAASQSTPYLARKVTLKEQVVMAYPSEQRRQAVWTLMSLTQENVYGIFFKKLFIGLISRFDQVFGEQRVIIRFVQNTIAVIADKLHETIFSFFGKCYNSMYLIVKIIWYDRNCRSTSELAIKYKLLFYQIISNVQIIMCIIFQIKIININNTIFINILIR